MAEPVARAPGPFWASFGPSAFWLVAFFLIPMLIIWAYSFGHTVDQTRIVIDGSFYNYGRSVQQIYLGILAKSLLIAGLTTLLCLIIGFPVAL
ncbi:MAG: ABC transporter permease, partial [Alphaproteobacteria bacterium]|nr:ABC transporter permease [Alphaproteobacteria bacterium]